ncbi:hypothetical protein KP509_10G028400 [Ceratopteris richardii]|nr:hypothetical protein KP509_10G028400 [Ceratopteris richardii]
MILSLVRDCHNVTQCNIIHAFLIKQGFILDAILGSSLVDAYAKCGNLEYACMVFLRLTQQDVVTWTALIMGHALHGLFEEALQLFDSMQQMSIEPNEVTYLCLIKACSVAGALAEGKHIHVHLASKGLDSNSLIGNSLCDMYMKCGSVEEGTVVFRKLPSHDVVAWNILIGGHAQFGDGYEALKLFQQFQDSNVEPNETTFVSVLQACANIGAIGDGEHAHKMILEGGFTSNIYVGNSLVHMYICCRMLEEASLIFWALPNRDLITWNTLISGLSQHQLATKVFELYNQMQESELAPNDVTFTAILQACSSKESLENGMQAHSDILKAGYESNMKVSRSLISMYVKCGSVEDVKAIVCTLPQGNTFVWNSVLTCVLQHGNIQESLSFFWEMRQEGIELMEATCISLFEACSSSKDLWFLMEIHAYAVECGLEGRINITNAMIGSYSKIAGSRDLFHLFNRLPCRDADSWIVILQACMEERRVVGRLDLLDQMMQEIVGPDLSTFLSIMGVCSNAGSLIYGMQTHMYIVKFGFDTDGIIGNSLIHMYMQCGACYHSVMVFDNLKVQDIVSWNALLTGFVNCELFEEALQIFNHMQRHGIESDQVTYVSVFQACANLTAIDFGHLVHTSIVKCGTDLGLKASNSLIDMYAKCNRSLDAASIFLTLEERDVASWNVLISAAAKEGHPEQAFHLFDWMQADNFEPNDVTCASVLHSCSMTADLKRGMQVHIMAVKKGYDLDTFVGISLIDMYGKCNCLQDAKHIFGCLPEKIPIAWNAMIAGYIQNSQLQEATGLFQMMQSEGVVATYTTFLCMLQVFSGLESINDARNLHALIIGSGLLDSKISSLLINMYGRCWHLETAGMVFNSSHDQDVVLWNALIASRFHSGQAREALQLFKQMLLGPVVPDQVMFILGLKVCSSLAALEQGKEIYSLIIQSGLDLELDIGNCLIDMYASCGSLEDARVLFHRLPEKDLVTWSTMISGYAKHNKYSSASSCFEDMQKECLALDDTAYLCMLSACNNAGLVDDGVCYFKKMRDESGLEPTRQHHNVMVDLLGRNGYIEEAKDLLDTLPYVTDIVAWTSLLGACEHQRNLSLAQQCFQHMNDKDAAAYVHMSNLYTHLGMQVNSEEVERGRKSNSSWKMPGRASIEVNGCVHEFAVGDNSHPNSKDIYAKLKSLRMQTVFSRVPRLKQIQGLSPAQEINDVSCGHCEKLAVVFGLLSLPEGTTIRIAKNLRVCQDCHHFMKTVSRKECREIIIIDTKYVHHFKDGVCGCSGPG